MFVRARKFFMLFGRALLLFVPPSNQSVSSIRLVQDLRYLVRYVL
jgi:hypothetical protein